MKFCCKISALEQPELYLRRDQDLVRHLQGRSRVRAGSLHAQADEGHQGRVPQASGHQVRMGHGQAGPRGEHHRPQLRQDLSQAASHAQISLLELSQ